MKQAILALWSFRGFVRSSVQREFQAKYRNSLLGIAWLILNPLAMIAVYTLIFSRVMHSRLPGSTDNFAYSIFLCAGIISWGLFAEVAQRGVNVFIDNANLIKKLSFPKLCLPLIVVSSAFINFAIVFGLFLIFLGLTGHFPGWPALLALPVLFAQLVFALGIGMTLAVFNVFFRDVGQLFNIALSFWFWMTPIVYPLSVLPDAVSLLVQLNPMTAIVVAYQNIFAGGHVPVWSGVGATGAIGLALCALGVLLLNRNLGDMVDEL